MPSSYTIFSSFVENHRVLSIVTLISLITFGMAIYSVFEINKLNDEIINVLLHLGGTDNNPITSLENFTSIYKFDTNNYKFDSFSNFSGHFRVIIKTLGGGPLSSLYFRVTDDKGRDITSNDVVVPQNNMVINFKTVEYTRHLNLEAKTNQTDIILESISIYAKGKSVKGFL